MKALGKNRATRRIPRPTLQALFFVPLILAAPLHGQDGGLNPEVFTGLRFRSIGPGIMTGRISDVAVDPNNKSVWYVGVSSGNVWKTVNRGTTWTPIFDDYGSYSIGAVTLDPNDSNVLWVGTGENASQRSAGYGDGIYKSIDAGESFTRMGLEDSEHIGDILVDPRDSDVVYAASQGPLWASGGDRGLYKTTDGGLTWDRILYVSEDTGIADIVFDAHDPDVIYAASYQRRRHVGMLIAGGPEGRIFKSSDAGASWVDIMDGIPSVDLGRIALETSPHTSGVVYALVAAQGEESGFFRSDNGGESWTKQSDYIVVDPQYYGEIFADPNRLGRVCAVDVVIHCSADEGVTFERLPLQGVHSDHHEIVFDADDPNYMLVGNDGGLYETWDMGDNWRHHDNLPITQFYRVGVSNDRPFYWVYGGTQDNGTLGGPSRTRNSVGTRNGDWTRIVGGDGFQARVDPLEQTIVYGMSQGARINRVDMATGETTSIAPPHTLDGDTLLWHWDIPLTISHFNNHRIYVLGSRLARSDNRGDDWDFISPNISRQIDRDTMEVMGRVWPDDAVWKNVYTNDYGVGVSFSESHLDADLMYVGTDDGLIQVTEDGGESWREIDSFPGIPTLIYVSEVLASRHDPDRVYALFNNHKRGDFTPYALKSNDRGRTWSSIAEGIPDRNVTWTLVEDPVNEDLLFLGTEFGLFFSVRQGDGWTRLRGGLPTIPVRDLEIQEREGDLVVATFGRGFYLLVDYTSLREISAERLAEAAILFPVRPALLYDPVRYVLGGSGDANYTVPNPPYGATVTYYLRELVAGEDGLFLAVHDAGGDLVAEVPATNEAGMQRVTWNLRHKAEEDGGEDGAAGERGDRSRFGPSVQVGTFTVTLQQGAGDSAIALAAAQTVRVVPLLSRDRR